MKIARDFSRTIDALQSARSGWGCDGLVETLRRRTHPFVPPGAIRPRSNVSPEGCRRPAKLLMASQGVVAALSETGCIERPAPLALRLLMPSSLARRTSVGDPETVANLREVLGLRTVWSAAGIQLEGCCKRI